MQTHQIKLAYFGGIMNVTFSVLPGREALVVKNKPLAPGKPAEVTIRSVTLEGEGLPEMNIVHLLTKKGMDKLVERVMDEYELQEENKVLAKNMYEHSHAVTI
jgi:hypothetical protein